MKKKGTITPDEVLLAKDIATFEKVLLSYLINRECNSGDDGEDPTQQEMAEAFDTTVITINKALGNLVDKGYLYQNRLKGYNNRFRNFYKICWQKIEKNNLK